jgi:hypothetical protein
MSNLMTRRTTSTSLPGHSLADKLGNPKANLIPCPVIRTLINEGMLTPDKDGMVEISQLRKALKDIGIAAVPREMLAFGAKNHEAGSFFKAIGTSKFNVYKLYQGNLDHPGSIAHKDGFDMAKLERLLTFSSDGKNISLADLGHAQKVALAEDPADLRGRVLGVAELSAILLVFGKRNAEGVKSLPKEAVISLWRDNMIPEGWKPDSVTALNLFATMAKFSYQQIFTNAGRSLAGVDNAIGRQRPTNESAVQGLRMALCPAMSRALPNATPPVGPGETAQMHQHLGEAAQTQSSDESAQLRS